MALVEISVYLCVLSIIVFFYSLEQTVLQASLLYLLFTVFFFIACYCIYLPFRLLVNPRQWKKSFSQFKLAIVTVVFVVVAV